MSAADKVVVVFSTCPPGSAEKLARHVVERRLVAGVNLIPQVTSFYRWKGDVQKEAETLLLMKCPAERVEALTDTLRKLHPYEVPQIIAVDVAEGSPDYLRWVYESTKGGADGA